MRSKILFFLSCTIPFLAHSQQDTTHHEPFLSISGTVDAYYRYDLARHPANDLTSFTHSHNKPEFGMAEVKLEHQTSTLDIVADLAAGPRENEYAVADKGLARTIKQLY